MPTNIPLTPIYGGDIALRSDPVNFPQNAEDQYTYLATFSTDWNTTIALMNTAIGETNGYANNASASASNAEESAGESASSALVSQSNANFVGKWANQSGAANIPYSVWNDGNNWQLLTNLGDVTASEPQADNADWQIIITPALTVPDVGISFNDGITIDKGYGTVDANGNQSCDFTHASATGSINKSGVSVDLLTNEPAITKRGISAYKAFTNEFLDSEFATDSGTGTGAVVNTGLDSPDLGTSGVSISGTAPSIGAHSTGNRFTRTITKNYNGSKVTLSAQIMPVTATYTTYMFLRNATTSEQARLVIGVSGGVVSILSTDATGGAMGLTSDIETTANGYYKLTLSMSSTSSADDYLVALHAGGVAGNETAWWGAQLSDVDGPYVKTTVSPVTRAPDICSIPMMGNMPAVGMPFTIFVDVSFNEGIITEEFIFSSQGNDLALKVATSNTLRFENGTGGIGFANNIGSELRRVTCVFDGLNNTVFVDGVRKSSGSDGSSTYSPVDDLHIGSRSNNTSNANSKIKNFEIYHSALSDAEIAAKGGPS